MHGRREIEYWVRVWLESFGTLWHGEAIITIPGKCVKLRDGHNRMCYSTRYFRKCSISTTVFMIQTACLIRRCCEWIRREHDIIVFLMLVKPFLVKPSLLVILIPCPLHILLLKRSKIIQHPQLFALRHNCTHQDRPKKNKKSA